MLTALDRLITAERVRTYAVLLLAGYVVGGGWMASTLRHGLDAQGKPLGADFIIFYGVSRLTLGGHAAMAYVGQALLMAERQVFPATRGIFLWCYPPTFQLVVWPVALAPYFVALAAWTAGGLAAYLWMIGRISTEKRAWLLALAFPGVFVNAIQGQTGFIVAALLGGGLLLLDRRPILAGILLGLLAIKPHFAVLPPLLLIGTGRWKAVAAALVSALGLATAATLTFGLQSWDGFLRAASAASNAFSSGALPLSKAPSTYAALLQLGAPAGVALALHGALAAVAAGLTLAAWRRPGSLELKAGLAVLATLIVLPYDFDYDLVLLAIPIGAVLKATAGKDAVPGVNAALVLLSVTPILVGPAAKWVHLPIGPLALWAGLFVVLKLLSGSRALGPDAIVQDGGALAG